ncbi:FitA-like ribbon-helix-helix domain-containing protein [Taklimakanibacter deserti]|uniref:FitA-like ribbon-helix-helix domain-containing protein n=1 Tax=Taklimakanibacter deserti TaxID=2267839 RepID=UPI0013C3EA41
MADILIDLPDDVIERLERRAASKGRSLEQELHEIVIAAARSDFIRKDRER